MTDEMDLRRIQELARRSWSQSVYCFTHFLDLRDLSIFQAALPSLPPVRWALFGGAEGCERQMLRFGSPEDCGYDAPFPIVCLQCAPLSLKFAEPLTHRDYLGALMALGIERETLGDIVVKKEGAYLFCEAHIAPFIQERLVQARHTSLSCKAVSALPEGALFETEKCTVLLSSQRLDALIARVYKLSRSEAQALFPAGRVYVSGRLCESPGHTPRTGDVISVRGLGRMRYVGVEGMSKKGRESTAVERYI